MSTSARTPPFLWVLLAALLAGAVGSQVVLDARPVPSVAGPSVTWVRSPEIMRRLALGFDDLLADIYWIRAVQYYGDTKLSTAEKKEYELLYPLLDMTTTLDPRFNVAYRFGAILLSEGYPNGPADPDAAIALLRKGIQTTPERWQYYHDAGFVEYWWRQDARAAANWMLEASKQPGAPSWLPPVAASFLAEGGARDSARALWTELANTTDQDWLRTTANRALLQLDAETAIEQLQPVVNRYRDIRGSFPSGWPDVVSAGLLRGIPLDPAGKPLALDPVSGAVDVSRDSPLFPLRRSGP
jgi:hypothetical protein